MKNLLKTSRKLREKFVIYKLLYIFQVCERKHMLKNCVRNYEYK